MARVKGRTDDMELQELLRKRLHSVLGLSAGVRLVEPQTLERSQGKAKRLDRRE